MKKTTGAILIAVSLLQLALIVSWPISQRGGESVVVPLPRGWSTRIIYSRGEVLIQAAPYRQQRQRWRITDPTAERMSEQFIRQIFDNPFNSEVHRLGFATVAFTFSGQRHVMVVLPVALLVAGLGVAQLAALVAYRRARRRRPGLCHTCGYDLRGSLGGCPECGADRSTKYP